MHRFPLISLFLLVLSVSAWAQPSGPPAKLVLPDNLATTATGKSVGGVAWGYIVILPSDPIELKGRAFRVYLKTGGLDSANAFSPLGEIRPVTDVATLEVMLSRAYSLGDSEENISQITSDIAEQWKVGNQLVSPKVSGRMAALINRANQSEQDASLLRQLALAHPAFRMPMGLAWGGPLNMAPGYLCTAEVREIGPTGNDLSVVGRCEFISGNAATLAAPAAPVQVPDLTAEGDLTVKLRWGLPTALRRQNLQTTGFRLWRVPNVSNGLPSQPTVAQIMAVPGAKQVTLAPILLNKLFSAGNPANASDAANFTADSITFFAADNNGRDETVNIVPKPAVPPFVQKVGVPHPENTTYRYYVAALDWLKQPGLVSTVGTGIAVRTIPPPVPANLQIEEVSSGGANAAINFRLSFDPNANNGTNVSTQRYAIYRGGSDAQSLEKRSYLLPNPELPIPGGQVGVNALTEINHQASRLKYLDSNLSATTHETQTYWYSVRAIHHTDLGDVYSAPSPPVFGTFHDYSGPTAPDGWNLADAEQALIREDSNQYVISANLEAGTTTPGKGRYIRMKAKRLHPTVTRVQFLVIDPRTQNAGTGPIIVFAPGENEVFFDTFWPDPAANPSGPNRLIFGAACQGHDTRPSYIAWKDMTWGGSIAASTTQRTEIGFECDTCATSSMTIANTLTGKMLINLGAPFSTSISGLTVQAALPSTAYNGRTALITITRSPDPTRVVLGKVSGNLVLFADPGRETNPATATYGVRILRDYQNYAGGAETFADLPPGWPSTLAWPPDVAAPSHLTPGSAGASTSLSVMLTLTPGTKEYRLYRQVDGGELSLISEGIGDYDTQAVKNVVVADQPNLPVSGRVCYYGQLVDQNGNTSPLKQIGSCIDIMAPVPVPVLNDPKAAGTAAAPQMTLNWFCPPNGVKRFLVRIVDITSGTTVASSPDATQLALAETQPIYFNPAPSGQTPTSMPEGTIFATSLNAPMPGSGSQAGTSSDHSLTFNIQSAHEYYIEVMAEGLGPNDVQRSLPRKFTWRTPVASGTVAWPARPLPKVVSGSPYGIVARELKSSDPFFSQVYASPLQLFSDQATPVIVPLGLVAVTSNGFSTSRAAPLPVSQVGSYPLLQVSTTHANYRNTIDPNAYLTTIFSAESASKTVPILPVVLYRQIVSAQGLDTTNTGDLVQVSPLVSSIAWRNESGRAAIIDPLIVTLPSYNGSIFLGASFWLPDTHPVISGYTYRYFLVRFDTTHEIEQVIDCGTVTISQ